MYEADLDGLNMIVMYEADLDGLNMIVNVSRLRWPKSASYIDYHV